MHVLRAIVDARRLDKSWLVLAVRTVLAGARDGTLDRKRKKLAAVAKDVDGYKIVRRT